VRLKAWSKLQARGLRYVRESDGLTFSLPPARIPKAASRVFIAGPMNLSDRFYNKARVDALTSLLLGER
jgi:hypothetical protein